MVCVHMICTCRTYDMNIISDPFFCSHHMSFFFNIRIFTALFDAECWSWSMCILSCFICTWQARVDWANDTKVSYTISCETSSRKNRRCTFHIICLSKLTHVSSLHLFHTPGNSMNPTFMKRMRIQFHQGITIFYGMDMFRGFFPIPKKYIRILLPVLMFSTM